MSNNSYIIPALIFIVFVGLAVIFTVVYAVPEGRFDSSGMYTNGRVAIGDGVNQGGAAGTIITTGGAILNTLGISTSSGLIILNGNVGIGTSIPMSKLDVSGDINSSGIIAAPTVNATNFNVGANPVVKWCAVSDHCSGTPILCIVGGLSSNSVSPTGPPINWGLGGWFTGINTNCSHGVLVR